jgi:hypothetical protein
MEIGQTNEEIGDDQVRKQANGQRGTGYSHAPPPTTTTKSETERERERDITGIETDRGGREIGPC